MKKNEKYKSFQEMKANSTTIDPANAAIVMERHKALENFVGFLRSEHQKGSDSKIKKPAYKS